METAGRRVGPYLHFGTQRANAAFAAPSYSKGVERARIVRFRCAMARSRPCPRSASARDQPLIALHVQREVVVTSGTGLRATRGLP